MKRSGLLLCVLTLMAPLASRALAADTALDVTVVTVEGEEQRQALVELTETGLKFRMGALKYSETAEVRFNNTVAAPAQKQPWLQLRNGDTLYVTILGGDDTKLHVRNEVLGELNLENKFLDAILFPNPAPGDALQDLLKGTPKEDLLLLSKGEVVTGFFEKLGDKNIQFNAGGQSRTFGFDQLAGFRLAPLDAYNAPTDLRATLQLKDGSRLTGKLLSLNGQVLKVEGIGGLTWTIPGDAIRNLAFKGGRLVYLTDIAPRTVEEKPYVGGMPVVYRWRKNQSARGEKLTIGTRTFERGLGVHSYTRLVYDLGGAYKTFLCEVGLDGAAPSGTQTAWKVLVDGKQAAGGMLKYGAPAEAIKLDVTNAKELELICDYGPDDDDAGDHLNWANARLVKP